MAPSTNTRRPLVTCSSAISASLSQQSTRCQSVVGVAPDLAGRSVATLKVARRWPPAVTRDSGVAAARPSNVTRLYVNDMRIPPCEHRRCTRQRRSEIQNEGLRNSGAVGADSRIRLKRANSFEQGGRKYHLPIGSRGKLRDILCAVGQCDRNRSGAQQVRQPQRGLHSAVVLVQDQVDTAKATKLLEDI